MRTNHRFRLFPVFLVTVYLLAACGGTLPKSTSPARGPKVDANIVAFQGVVEAMNGAEWTVSGQKITLDPQTALDPTIRVGDEIHVEAQVSAGGGVIAMKVESTTSDSMAASSPDVDTISKKHADGRQDDSAHSAAGVNENEVLGAVEAITSTTITVNGVTYDLTSLPEIKDALNIGDAVKLHVTVAANGMVTVREIEKSVASLDDGSNGSNGTDSGPTRHPRKDKSGRKNGHSNDGSNHGSNGNHGGGG